ncbi:hypothetical protein SAMN05421856_10365 [Chryseobacterium taichungense]|uniref:Uncharacterized protein n=1 Tax=Chryseobacterium taichungense TaxID=295069 RepID=A0A1H7Y6W5_9FLAO|nr:hypothetical protein SAMN05421856_10365 [Chryseobacterium taichungense]
MKYQIPEIPGFFVIDNSYEIGSEYQWIKTFTGE